MTAGYDPGDPAVHDATAPPQDPSDTGRLGPRPPRFGPSPGPSTGSYPTVPPAGPYGPGPGSPAAPRTGPIPVPGFAPQGPPGPPGAGRPAPPSAPRRGGRLGVVAFILALLLLPVVGVQAAMIMNLSSRLDASQRNAASARGDTDSRLKGLESRTGDLEKHSIDPQAVAHDSLPSVFRVVAGNSLGTAFAVGRESPDGTDLVTNFHVALEHQDQRFPAKITRVDPVADLALLHSTEKFPRLAAATTPGQPGQPVVVVGAPLGLESTVTSGVISATRTDPTSGQQVLQFDAPINPGNSGGPVINAQRQVVGIATSQFAGAAGIGFAIPIQVACQSLGVC